MAHRNETEGVSLACVGRRLTRRALAGTCNRNPASLVSVYQEATIVVTAKAGQTVTVILTWESLAEITEDYVGFVHLVGPKGRALPCTIGSKAAGDKNGRKMGKRPRLSRLAHRFG